MSEFGAARVFRDVEAIAPGERFVDVLRDKLARCGVLLAVIGPGWLRAEVDGRRRLDDPEDHVRMEIATALERAIPVIPVLVDTPFPGRDALPAPLAPLADYQAAVLHEVHFHADVDHLIGRLRAIGGTAVRRASAAPRRVGGDRPWLCRDPDWFSDGPEPVWPTVSIEWPAVALAAVRNGTEGGVSPAVAGHLEPMLERLWQRFGIIVPGVCMRAAAGAEYAVRVAGSPERRGVSDGTALDAPIGDLEAVIRDDPKAVVGHQEVASLLTALDPDVLEAVLTEQGALSDLVLVCRALLAEYVPITALATIVAGCRRLRPTGASLVEIVEELRRSPEIRGLLPGNDEHHSTLALSEGHERAFARSLDLGSSEPVLAMEAETVQAILGSVQETLADVSGEVAVVVENASIRPFVRKLLALNYPYLPVLARREVLA